MIPQSLQDNGLGKDLKALLCAYEKRFGQNWTRKGNAWTYHQGRPNREYLDKARNDVWVNFLRIGPGFDASFNVDDYVSEWEITITFPDEGNDPAGFHLEKALDIIGDSVEVLRETVADVGMDGSVDFSEAPDVSLDHGAINDGGNLGVVRILQRLHHKRQPVRCL